jgi:hypothetical protein
MIKALFLIFEPIATWERIRRTQRSLGFILLSFLLPMLLLNAVVEGYGLITWGKFQSDVTRMKIFPKGEAVLFEVLQFVLGLLIVLIGAKLIKSLGETFHGRHTFTQAFGTVAYGLSPFFLCRLLDGFPSVSPWVTWAIGILLTIAVLYQGVPRMMEPDPPHAFGLYLMSSLLLFLITGLARFMTAWYLQGRFVKLESLISALSQRLPF